MKLEDFIKVYNISKKDYKAIINLIEFKNNYKKVLTKQNKMI